MSTPNVGRISLDEHGLLRDDHRWIALSGAEEAVMTMLLERFGLLVRRRDLCLRIWPDREPTLRALDVTMHRLRKRIAPLGLHIVTVRGRGFVLDEADP